TNEQLLVCMAQIIKFTKDAVDAIQDARQVDADAPTASLYRTLMAPQPDAAADEENEEALADMFGKGSAINCQSIVLKFGSGNAKTLLAADMQFAEPQVTGISAHMRKLRDRVAQAGPFRFVKTTHHTSYNGMDEGFYNALGRPPLLLHSGGSNDPNHPDKDAL